MRLLVAEDNQDIARALAAVLEKNGYTVDAVYNGSDALDYAMSGNYDGVILDIMMPGCDGLEALRRMRRAGLTVPALMLTARAELDDRVAGLDAGADDYLPKPFDMRELLARVRAMLRRRSDYQPDVLQKAGIALDRGAMEIAAAGGTARLVAREFQVMEMLMERFGQVVTTESLMEHIWGWDSDVEVNIVWVTVSNLRKKLLAIHAPARIGAVRGVGYRLEGTV